MKYPNLSALPKLHPDEPFFFVRAQDANAAAIVLHYGRLIGKDDPKQANEVIDLAEDIGRWQAANPDKVKIPD